MKGMKKGACGPKSRSTKKPPPKKPPARPMLPIPKGY